MGYSLWNCKELDMTEWLTLRGIKGIHIVVQPAPMHGSTACFFFPGGNSVPVKPRLPNPPTPSPWHPALCFLSKGFSEAVALTNT